jgi:hypothetical protein
MTNTTTTLQVVIDAQNNTEKVFSQVQGQLGQLNTKLQGMVPMFKGMAVAGGVAFGAIAAGVVDTLKAAGEANLQMAKFNATMDSMGTKGKAAKQALLDVAAASIKLGFDDEDTAVSLSKLYQRTGSVTEAVKLNALAMDLARAKSIDLTSATNLINLALSGGGRALLQYGIIIKDTASPLEALGILQKKVGGQAEAAAKTFSVQMEALNIQITNVKESIGNTLIPVITDLLVKVGPVVDKIMVWVDKHPELTKYIILSGLAITGLIFVLGTLGIAIAGISAGVTALGITLAGVFTATGVGLVVAGIVWIASNLKDIVGALYGVDVTWRDVWKELTSWWDGMINGIADTINYLIGLFDKLKNSWVGTAAKITGQILTGDTFGAAKTAFSLIPSAPLTANESNPGSTPSTLNNITLDFSNSAIMDKSSFIVDLKKTLGRDYSLKLQGI